MRIRAAGALLMAPVLAVFYEAFQTRGEPLGKLLFGRPPGAEAAGFVQPAGWLVTRDVLVGVILIVGILAICGVRQTRLPVVLLSGVLIILYLPWMIYDLATIAPSDLPPLWLRQDYPWYFPTRASAALWTGVLIVAAVLASTDPEPTPAAEAARSRQAPPAHVPQAPINPWGAPVTGQQQAPSQWGQPAQPAQPGYQPGSAFPTSPAVPPAPTTPAPAGPGSPFPSSPAAPGSPFPTSPAVPPAPTPAVPNGSPAAAPWGAPDGEPTQLTPETPKQGADEPTQVQPRVDP